MEPLSERVYSLHYIGIDIENGITNEQFESFVQKEGVYLPNYPGWHWYLLRGLRGERTGQYLMVYEIDSIESRDRFRDSTGMKTQEAKTFWSDHPEASRIADKWKKYASFAALPTLYTDYRLLAENNDSTLKPGSKYRERPGQPPQTRVIGIHNLALREGVSADDFERFIRDNHHRIVDYPGWKFHLLKGDRGNRLDQYVVLMEIESVEAVEMFYPDADIPTEEVDRFAKAHRDTKLMYEEWKQMASFSGSPQMYTDYLVVAESR